MFAVGQVLQERYELCRLLDDSHPISDRKPRQTWLAKDLMGNDASALVVLKFLQFGGRSQWADLRLFEREVQVLRQLDHPRIPRCGDSFHLDQPEEWMGFVETYIPGESLQTLLNQGRRFSEGAVRSIAEQVLEILIYLHGCSPLVLHRDIKPSNLILTPKRQVYLIDFGAVQDRPRPEGQSFTVVGTYGYTPIEQFGGQAAPASDLYALGATLIHLLAGISPAEMVQADLQLDFCDRIQATPQLTTWLTQMTAPALADRFQSAQQALTALKAPIALPVLEPPQSRILLQPTDDSLKVSIPPLITLKTMAWLELTLLGLVAGGLILVLLPLGLQSLLLSVRTADFVGMGSGLLLSVLGGVALLMVLTLLKRFLGSTQLTVTTDAVWVQRQLWGITYHQFRCPLESLSRFDVLAYGPADTTVIVTSTQKTEMSNMPLVERLSPEEGQWLVQEITAWRQQKLLNP
ncbi:MAG: serine/threonine-protein kinase [Thermosynechococcaceae cyanobacterium]